jgi:hypothetical protein
MKYRRRGKVVEKAVEHPRSRGLSRVSASVDDYIPMRFGSGLLVYGEKGHF